MSIGDTNVDEINSLMKELWGEARAFYQASQSDRVKWYTKQASVAISEANSRCVMACSSDPQKRALFSKSPADGLTVKLAPKSPQRKMDGARGAQMNFWLYINQGYHKNFNMHVNVVTLEKAFTEKFTVEKDKDGFGYSKKQAESMGGRAASALRDANDWSDFAKK